jgi:inner membrane protein
MTAGHPSSSVPTPKTSVGLFGLAIPVAVLVALVATPADGPDFWLPMGFIIVGVLLFLWEVSMPGFFIAIPATVAVILGVIGLFVEGFFTSPWVILIGVLVALPVTALTIRVYRSLAPPSGAPTTTTGESMAGREGVVTVEVEPETTRGKVRLSGTVWSARSSDDTRIPVGTRVVVQMTSGVHVVVAPKQPLGGSIAPADDELSKPAHAEPTERSRPMHREGPFE